MVLPPGKFNGMIAEPLMSMLNVTRQQTQLQTFKKVTQITENNAGYTWARLVSV